MLKRTIILAEVYRIIINICKQLGTDRMSNAKKIMKWLLGHSRHKILSANNNVYKTVKHMDSANAIILNKMVSHKSYTRFL